MAETMFPLEDTEYLAADAQLFFCTRSTGVYASSCFPVTAINGMKITIGKGIAWLKYDDFGGVVYANTASKELTVSLSPASGTRIDGICIRYDPVTRSQSAMYIKEGTASASPSAPALTRDSSAYEIMLYTVTVGAGVTAINAANITDTRLSPSVCGVMGDSITSIDTSAIDAQVNAFILRMQTQTQTATENVQEQADEKLDAIQSQVDTALADMQEQTSGTISSIEAQLEEVYDVEKVNYQVLSATVPTSAWALSGDLYKATVTVTGLLASDTPVVDIYCPESNVVALTTMWEAWCGVIATYSQTGSLVLYANDFPGVALELRLQVTR